MPPRIKSSRVPARAVHWFFSALMSELLSIFLPFAVCISRTSIWPVSYTHLTLPTKLSV